MGATYCAFCFGNWIVCPDNRFGKSFVFLEIVHYHPFGIANVLGSLGFVNCYTAFYSVDFFRFEKVVSKIELYQIPYFI